MKKYFALLRGINVGGKNKIAMPELKAAFDACGFSRVQTYINSGNVIFFSELADEAELQRLCETAIADRFQIQVPVAVLSAEDLTAAMRNAPDWWDADSDAKHNALFLIAPATPEAIFEQIDFAPEYEQVSSYGQVIFWSASLKTFSRSRLTRIVHTPSYTSITIRGANTAKKLLAFAQRQD